MATNLQDTIDDAAAKAKELAKKAGHAIEDAADKVTEVTKKAAEKLEDAGEHAGKKLGASS